MHVIVNGFGLLRKISCHATGIPLGMTSIFAILKTDYAIGNRSIRRQTGPFIRDRLQAIVRVLNMSTPTEVPAVSFIMPVIRTGSFGDLSLKLFGEFRSGDNCQIAGANFNFMQKSPKLPVILLQTN